MNNDTERIDLVRKKEKEARELWHGLYLNRDLKYLLEPEFNYKEYFKEIIEGLIFVLFFGAFFYLLWFVLP